MHSCSEPAFNDRSTLRAVPSRVIAAAPAFTVPLRSPAPATAPMLRSSLPALRVIDDAPTVAPARFIVPWPAFSVRPRSIFGVRGRVTVQSDLIPPGKPIALSGSIETSVALLVTLGPRASRSEPVSLHVEPSVVPTCRLPQLNDTLT